jgi:23S rRNA pseudouridine955/2504/2580 synthase/23S rRNA pseudouridine1911/1915/1917 synthase
MMRKQSKTIGRSEAASAAEAGRDGRVAVSIVGPEGDEARLDRWLGERFTYRSRSAWQEEVKGGAILLNGRTTRSAVRLKTGDHVEFVVPDTTEPCVDERFRIVFEDDAVRVIDKSGNLPCHPGGRFFRNTLWNLLRQRNENEVHLVNRLDRETSGLVLAAKTGSIASKLQQSQLSGKIEKRYLLAVFGAFPVACDATGILRPDPDAQVRKRRIFVSTASRPDGDSEGEWAETAFRRIVTDGVVSFLDVRPRTGRFHQIRATACALGYPVVGDKLYGPDETCYLRFVQGSMSESDHALLGMGRQALHACGLAFPHPNTGEIVRFDIPPPDDMLEFAARQSPAWVASLKQNADPDAEKKT